MKRGDRSDLTSAESTGTRLRDQALTDGKLGVAFLSAFETSRSLSAARPIAISRIGIGISFTKDAFHMIAKEAKWSWLPTVAPC